MAMVKSWSLESVTETVTMAIVTQTVPPAIVILDGNSGGHYGHSDRLAKYDESYQVGTVAGAEAEWGWAATDKRNFTLASEHNPAYKTNKNHKPYNIIIYLWLVSILVTLILQNPQDTTETFMSK
ncbi:hypothetical protein EDC01DRAFT_629444 [Geopyxis carbonaria]|nr:hypothetical protein EDC01DRAFT_629444 [Geopyxis carbonaria]